MSTDRATTGRESEWYDEFWGRLTPWLCEDDQVSAVRILGELLDDVVMVRQGDELRGTELCFYMHLSPEDQFLIRRIQQAVEHASSAIGEDSDHE